MTLANLSSKQTGPIEKDDMMQGNKMKELKIERSDLSNSVDGIDMVSGFNHIKVRKEWREEFDFEMSQNIVTWPKMILFSI